MSHSSPPFESGDHVAIEVAIENPQITFESEPWTSATTAPEIDVDAATGDVTPVVDFAGCPIFSLAIVGAHELAMGNTAAYEAHATGVTESTLEYGWSVTRGDLSTTQGARTELTCTASGPVALTLWAAVDSDCSQAMALTLTCLPPTAD
jgi:hypothetical protein